MLKFIFMNILLIAFVKEWWFIQISLFLMFYF